MAGHSLEHDDGCAVLEIRNWESCEAIFFDCIFLTIISVPLFHNKGTDVDGGVGTDEIVDLDEFPLILSIKNRNQG